VGTTAGTVAAGAHTHDATAIVTGLVPFARLPVGTTSTAISVGNHTHQASTIPSTGLGFSTNVNDALGWLNTYKANANDVGVADAVTSTAFNRTISTGYYAMYMGNGTLIGRNVSSRRYKNQIQPADVDVDAVLGLEPVTFHHMSDPDADGRHLGLIAEDSVDVPFLVAYDVERDGEGNPVPDAEPRPETVRYETVLPVVLLAVVKAQDAQIRALQDRVDALEGV
jgi:hypothetical protein